MKTLRSVLILALLAVTARGDDWSHLGRDDGRTRRPSETIAAPGLLASVTTGIESIASPVASDGFLILAGLDGTVRALRESDQQLLWTVSTGVSVIATPLVDRGRIFVSGLDGTVRVLRLADGLSLGSTLTGNVGHSSPILSGSRIYLGSAFPNPSLTAINAATQEIEWSAPLDQVSYSSPAIGGDKVLLPTNNGTLFAFDAATGAAVWSTALGGTPDGSSPLILGSSVFVVVDGTVIRLSLDTGTPETGVLLADTPPADTISAEWSCSSLSSTGTLLAGLARVDYAVDHDHDGFVDAWTLREFAFAVDPAAMTLAWQSPMGSLVEVDLNAIPPYRILPAPVSLGAALAFVSSLDSDLRLLSLAGAPSGSFGLDAPSQSSLLLANARLYALTKAGTLAVLEDPATPQPPSTTGLAPAGAHLSGSPATLSWNPGAPGSTYTVRLAQDGDILMDWDLEQILGATSIPCPPLDAEHLYTWAVRVRDASGAFAPWTMAQFAIGTPPQPPSGLIATPRHGRVVLSWTASPSADIAGYRVAFGLTGGAVGAPADVGNVTSAAVEGLVIGTGYTFEVSAVDSLGFVSAPVSVTATPVPTVSIGGTLYSSIAAALAAAGPGDVVQLSKDVYTIGGTLQIPAGVKLQGVNGLDTQIAATGLFPMFVADTGSTVSGVQLRGGSIGIQVTGQSVVISSCVIQGMSDAGIDVSGIVVATNNTIVGNGTAGIRSGGRVESRNNIVQGNGVGLVGIVISKYNDVSDGYQGCAPGEGDKSAPVTFLDPAGSDFREQPSQPSLDAGSPADDYSKEPAHHGYRINMGAFGNTEYAAPSPEAPKSDDDDGGCGLLGLEGVLLLGLLALRRR